MDTNWFVRVYHDRIGPPERPGEAYGYWIVVAGTALALAGGVALLAVESLPLTATMFDVFLVGGSTALVVAPVLVLMGLVVRLPLQPFATVLAALGATASVGGIGWVLVMVDLPLTAGKLLVPGAAYIGGLGLFVLAAIVVPLATTRYVERDPTAVGHPYYELREIDQGWVWRLCDRDGHTVATSPRTYSDRSGARAALERMSMRAPMAGIELAAGE